MLVGRIMTLTLAVLLAIGLGIGTVGNSQSFTASSQTTLSAAPDSGDCSACKDCATPCAPAVVCSTACLSLGLASAVQGTVLHGYAPRRLADTGWQPSSAELLTPTPPPKLIHIA
jgi:hypothetical protein